VKTGSTELRAGRLGGNKARRNREGWAMSLKAIVLAAGKGTRMGGDRPKVLHEAKGKTLLAWTLGALADAGVTDVVAVVGYRQDEVVATLPTGVRWAGQSPQLGTGHAVGCARASFPEVDDVPLLVTCGDMPLVKPATFRLLADLRERENADVALLTVPVPPESRFGRVLRLADGSVDRIVEWKDATPAERAIDEGNAGVYCFRPSALWPALERISNRNAAGEYYLPDVIPVFRAAGGRVVAYRSDDALEALGVNTPEDLAQVERAII